MDLFRRKKKNDGEDDEFDEDFDFDDLDEDVEGADVREAISGEPPAMPDGGPDMEPLSDTGQGLDDLPTTDLNVEPDPTSGGLSPDGGPDQPGTSKDPFANQNDDDLDFGDEFADEFDGDDEEEEGEGSRFSGLKVSILNGFGLKAKLAPVMENRWARYGIYAGVGVFILVVVGGITWLFIGGGDDPAETQSSLGSGGLLPPSGGGLNNQSEAEGEAISAERAQAGIQAFDSGGGLNAALDDAMEGGGLMVRVASGNAYSRYPDRDLNDPLPKAPNADLLEFRGETVLPLPRIADDGRVSWQEYARPSDVDAEIPRVGVIITELGLSKSGTLAAIRKLPPEVTLSFSPYAEDLDQWMIRSRRAGHEVMLGLPLESRHFPIEDHGPRALKVDLPTEENIILLENLLELLQGSIGVEVLMGSRFTGDMEAVRDLLNMLNARGLMIVDHKENPLSKIPLVAAELGSPLVVSDVRLDDVMATTAINARLKDAERLVKSSNTVIVTTSMTPAIMERLQLWIATLRAMGIGLAPVSSFVSLKGSEQ